MAKAIFEKTKIDFDEFSMKLTASYMLEFANQDDNIITVGYPNEWVDCINNIWKGNTTGYIAYKVYGKPMKHGTYNRITTYKKIWGLLNITKGNYDGFYDTFDERVYWGIKVLGDTDELLSTKEDFTVLIPRNKKHDVCCIIDQLLKWKYCFPTITDCYILSLVQRAVPTSIIYRLSDWNSDIMLDVFLDNSRIVQQLVQETERLL